MHHTYKVSLEELSIFRGALQYIVHPSIRPNLRYIKELCDSVSAWGELEGSSERYLSEVELAALRNINLDALTYNIGEVSDEDMRFGFDDGVAGEDMKRQCSQTMRHLRGLVRIGNPWITKRGKLITLAAAESVLRLEERPGVILDATARVDARYDLLEDKARIIAPIRGVRNYSNVNLWLVPNQRVGKEYMAAEGGWKLWSALAEQIQQKFGSERNVLVCCHKEVREQIEIDQTTFSRTAYAHWGAITGKNEWRDYDTVVIFGLNYLDRSATAEAYVGMRGATSDDWLQSREHRRYNRHADIRDALKLGHLTISVIQAINRVRCRRTNDAVGGCDRTDIIMLLPKGAEGEALVNGLRAEMPGLQVHQWQANVRTRRERSAPSKIRVFEFLLGAPYGLHTNKDVSAKLGVSRSTYDRVVADFRNERSTDAQQLRRYGVRYVSEPGGYKLSGFIKEATATV